MNIEKLDFAKVTQEPKSFTTHLNIVLQNVNNPMALGIWCYLSSLPPDWKINKSHLRKHFEIGRDKLDKILNILKKYNLIQLVQDKKDNGNFNGYSIKVKVGYEFYRHTEIQCDGHRHTEKPDDGKPVTGKQHLQKKEDTKEIKEKKKDKSFYRKANEQKHEFAEMKNEAACIQQSDQHKRSMPPDGFKELFHGILSKTKK